MNLSLLSNSIDAIISSPPYFGALDYARDNRLRLWFLGVSDWRELDHSLTANDKVYVVQMKECLRQMDRVLKNRGYCVLVLGDVERNGVKKNTAQIISDLAHEVSDGRLVERLTYTDEIPDVRRSRRQTRTTKYERILVMEKISS
jgi:DNA modification methylase